MLIPLVWYFSDFCYYFGFSKTLSVYRIIPKLDSGKIIRRIAVRTGKNTVYSKKKRYIIMFIKTTSIPQIKS